MNRKVTGLLKKAGDEYTILPLSYEQLHLIKALQTEAFEHVTDKASLQMLTDEEYQTILSGKGYMVGTFVFDKLIAFRAMLDPSIHDPEHLAADIGLSKDRYKEVIYSEISIVHPHYRGNHLQTIMGKVVMDLVDRDRFNYVAATVAPGNIPSMKDKFNLGMHIVTLTTKYDGKPRYVYVKNLATDHSFKNNVTDVLVDDTMTQKDLFNEGYSAIGLKEINYKLYLKFAKEV